MANGFNLAFSLYPYPCAARQGLVGPVNHLRRPIDNGLMAIDVGLALLDGNARLPLPRLLISANDVLVNMNTFKHDAALSRSTPAGSQMRQCI